MVKEIPLTQGEVALVDDEDFEWLTRWAWCLRQEKGALQKYAHCAWRRPDGRKTTMKMHRLIMAAKPGVIIDHIDRDGLNNQRGNLREVTPRESSINGSKRSVNTSGYIGVSWDKSKGKWEAYVSRGGKKIFIGRFSTAEEAAIARDAAAKIHYGAIAVLNFPRS